MKPERMGSERLADAFNQSVGKVDTRLKAFIETRDSFSTAAIRKATKRLRASYAVLPKKVRQEPRVRRYVSASLKLSKVAGRVRDTDVIAAWTMQISEGKDKQSFITDLDRLRSSNLRPAVLKAKKVEKLKKPSLGARDLEDFDIEKRVEKVERRLATRVDDEFEEFLSTQEIEVMHALRKDSKRLRHHLELTRDGKVPPIALRLRSIQDDLGAIRDHDLVIDYLRSRVRLTSTGALIREEIAKRHARLEDFVTKNRGQGHLIPVSANEKS
jgi:CHAD domain-containing protein